MSDEDRMAIAAFVRHAPHFTPNDWAAIPPEWKVIYEAARELLRERIRISSRGQWLPARLFNISMPGVVEALVAISLNWNNEEQP